MSPDTNITADTAVNIVTATLNYLLPSAEKPGRHLYDRQGLPQWTGIDDSWELPITDAREYEDEFTCDPNGFALLRVPSAERDFT